MYHQEELDSYREAMQEFRSKGNHRARVDMDVVDHTDESPSETRAQSSHGLEQYQDAETHDDAHDEAAEEEVDDEWLEELDLELASPALARMSPKQRTMAASFKRRRLRNAKSVYEQLAMVDNAETGEAGSTTLPDALYESDDDKPARLSGTRGRGKAKRKLSRKTRSINSRSSSRTSGGSDGSETDFLAPITLGHVSEKPSQASLLGTDSEPVGTVRVADNDVDVLIEPLASLSSLVEPITDPSTASVSTVDEDPFASLANLMEAKNEAPPAKSVSPGVVSKETKPVLEEIDPLASLASLLEPSTVASTAAVVTKAVPAGVIHAKAAEVTKAAPAKQAEVAKAAPAKPEDTSQATGSAASAKPAEITRTTSRVMAAVAAQSSLSQARQEPARERPPRTNSKLLELKRLFESSPEEALAHGQTSRTPSATSLTRATKPAVHDDAVAKADFAGLVNLASQSSLLEPEKPVQETAVVSKTSPTTNNNHVQLRRLVEGQHEARTDSTCSYDSDARFETMTFPKPSVHGDLVPLLQGKSHTQQVANAKLALASHRPASPGEFVPKSPGSPSSPGTLKSQCSPSRLKPSEQSTALRHRRLQGADNTVNTTNTASPHMVTDRSSTSLNAITEAAASNRRSGSSGPPSPQRRRRSSALSQGDKPSSRRASRSATSGPEPQAPLATNARRRTTDPELDDMDKLAVLLGVAPGSEPKLKRNSRSVRRASWALQWAEQDTQEDESDGEVEI